MATTREIYSVSTKGKNGQYAGYARFEGNTYLGSAGGTNKRGRTVRQGQSQVRNTINTAGARGRSRNPMLY